MSLRDHGEQLKQRLVEINAEIAKIDARKDELVAEKTKLLVDAQEIADYLQQRGRQ